MKNRVILNSLVVFFVLLLNNNQNFAQGGSCLGADPFCSDQTYTFPASTNTTAQNGPDYECLTTQPNPAWYFLKIGTAGNIEITLTNSQGVDIDFICWGPFADPTSPCTAQLTNNGNGFFGFCSSYPCGNTVDCSYDPQAVEVVNIPNAQVGDYYILLITNYSGDPTDITAQQTGGNGSTDCSIVDPCTITSLTTNVSACDATNNQYSVTGVVNFTDPPTTGQLIVEDCSGAQQTFNAPFTTSQAYSLTGLNSNGASCNITAYFTDDNTCTSTTNYNAPAPCMCNADAGTTTVTINGSSTNNYVLCDGDQISIVSNNDDVDPLDRGIINGATYSPGLGFAVYFCPPTPNTPPLSDPCFSGFFTGTLDNFIETNNGGTSPLLTTLINNGVTITNNTIYIAPITLYNGTDQTYDAACFDVGDVIEITYLQPIQTTVTESCANSTATVTLQGGYPNYNASNFTLSNLSPSNASLSSTTVANNTSVTISGLLPGDNYSFDYIDGNGCGSTFSAGPFGGISITVSDTTICNGGTATLAPNISGGTPPYNYSWDNGSTSSSITTSPTATETNCITVTDNAGCSSGQQCITVNIHPNLNLTVSNDTTICLGDTAILIATASGGIGTPYTYTWDNGLPNSSMQLVHPTTDKTYSVTIGDGCETPTQTQSINVTVIQPPTVTFSANQTSGCPPLPVSFTANGVPNNYSQSWDFGDGGTSNINNASYNFSVPGCWDITLYNTSPEGCVSSTVLTNYICVDQPPIVDFYYTPNRPTTFASTVDFTNTTSGATTYVWSVNSTKDTTIYTTQDIQHQFPTTQGGKYEVCLTATNANGCAASVCKNIIVLEEILIYVPNAFTPNEDNRNDYFSPILSGVKEDTYTLRIFNRWGAVVFETTDIKKGWDGTINGAPAKTDTYVWRIDVTDILNNEDHKFLGHISLIR